MEANEQVDVDEYRSLMKERRAVNDNAVRAYILERLFAKGMPGHDHFCLALAAAGFPVKGWHHVSLALDQIEGMPPFATDPVIESMRTDGHERDKRECRILATTNIGEG